MGGAKQPGRRVRREIRIGVISDTHGLYDPAIGRHFADVARILHAGDIGSPTVIEALEALAPVSAVSGNIDGFEASGVNRVCLLEMANVRIALRHILYERGRLTREAREFLDLERPDVCVYGHSHQPKAEWYGATLLFNPGSAGPKRFSLPRCIGLLTICDGKVTPTHIVLPDRPQDSR